MKLSIIIPVYNVEAYIKKCLLSCIYQTGALSDNYEIIIVNDGSKDNSMSVIEETLKSTDSNISIKIITQKNMGLSEARNTGLRNAMGDYVWFVDSDDWIDKDSVESIISELKKWDVDILQMPFKFIYENNTPTKIEKIKEISEPISGYDSMKITRFPNLTQSRIYRRLFLIDNNLRFEPGILHEDAEFKPRSIWKAKSIITLNKRCYNYLKREKDSITASFTMRNAIGRWYGVKSMYEFSKNLPFKDRLLFHGDMNFNMYFIITGLKQLSKPEQKKMIEELSGSRHIFRRLMCTTSPKKLLVYSILSLSPKLFLNIYSR